MGIGKTQELEPSILSLIIEKVSQEFRIREEQVSFLLNYTLKALNIIQLQRTVRSVWSLHSRRLVSTNTVRNSLIDVLIVRDAF